MGFFFHSWMFINGNKICLLGFSKNLLFTCIYYSDYLLVSFVCLHFSCHLSHVYEVSFLVHLFINSFTHSYGLTVAGWCSTEPQSKERCVLCVLWQPACCWWYWHEIHELTWLVCWSCLMQGLDLNPTISRHTVMQTFHHVCHSLLFPWCSELNSWD